MKKIFILLALTASINFGDAQETDGDADKSEKKVPHDFNELVTYDKSRLFFGGTVNLGYSSGYDNSGNQVQIFNIGGLPEIGHRFAKYLDIGISGKINYTSQKYQQINNASIKSTYYGLGLFCRVTVIDNFFVQLMPETNKLKQTVSGINNYNYTAKINSTSFLAGAGYKYIDKADKFFYYVVLLFDLKKDPYSPYVTYNQSGSVVLLPVFRVGFNYYPFKK